MEERRIILAGITNGSTKTAIAQTIGKDKSTVGKEIRLHRTLTYKCKMPLECNCLLYTSFTPEEWKTKSSEYDEIRDNMLGWDITDYGLGNFEKVGFALITLRNGNQNNPKYKKVYAEKLLMLKENQHSPMHFHWKKSEDIINRGGGTLIIHVYNDKDGELDDTDVLVNSDGRSYYVPAGTGVELKPGESITLWPHQYLSLIHI